MAKMIICAWCGKEIGLKGGAADECGAHLVTHTICPACKVKVIDSFKKRSK